MGLRRWGLVSLLQNCTFVAANMQTSTLTFLKSKITLVDRGKIIFIFIEV
jgi:hypothetical protein